MSFFKRKEEPKEEPQKTFQYWRLMDHDPDLDAIYERVIETLGSVGCIRECVEDTAIRCSYSLKFPESEPCVELLASRIYGWHGPTLHYIEVRGLGGKTLCGFKVKRSTEETQHDNDPLFQAYNDCMNRLNAEEKRKGVEDAMALLNKAMGKS